jgi:hypothetical protein
VRDPGSHRDPFPGIFAGSRGDALVVARLADWLCRHKGIRVSHDSVLVVWQRFCLAPHRTEGFRCSTGPQLEAKVRDVVGLYLAPPENAVGILCRSNTRLDS